ncbi:hypothetical protein FRB93_000614 [Tulasnella sp. JGI-2019a]|nr:hypothetical protein FRB93_000614 [Tulasnella sp. JGI-2019a]
MDQGLPLEARAQDITKLLEVFGPVRSLRVKPGFAFATFDKEETAGTFMDTFHGHKILGSIIVVQWALTERQGSGLSVWACSICPATSIAEEKRIWSRSSPPLGTRRSFGRTPHKVIVSGLNRHVGWQDLKDFGRTAGNIAHADIDPADSHRGILEYFSEEDAKSAAIHLDGMTLRGDIVAVWREMTDSRKGLCRSASPERLGRPASRVVFPYKRVPNPGESQSQRLPSEGNEIDSRKGRERPAPRVTFPYKRMSKSREPQCQRRSSGGSSRQESRAVVLRRERSEVAGSKGVE